MSHAFTAMVALAASLGVTACAHSDASASAGSSGRVAIAVTEDGFVATGAHVKVGQPVTLVVTRKVEKTCATDIVIQDYGINRPLPENQPVEITFTPRKPGPIRYACAMNMVSGELVAD